MQGEKVCLNMKDAASLKNLAYDQKYWERQVKASKGFEWSKKMLNEMMYLASKFDEEEVIECALNKVDLYHQEQNDAPRIVQLVADGDIETALQRIDAFGGEDKEGLQRKFILYMLCLMELTLLDSKDKDHAKSGIEKILKHFDENIPANQPDLINWNDFFPSYLIFNFSFYILKMGIKNILIFKRTDKWSCEWLNDISILSDLQIDFLFKTIEIIKDESFRDNIIVSLTIKIIKQGKVNEAINLINQKRKIKDINTILKVLSVELVVLDKFKESLEFIDLISEEEFKISTLLYILNLQLIREDKAKVGLILYEILVCYKNTTSKIEKINILIDIVNKFKKYKHVMFFEIFLKLMIVFNISEFFFIFEKNKELEKTKKKRSKKFKKSFFL